TEHGVADLRGKDPHERARIMIENCADPAYRPILRDYLELTEAGHEPLSLCFGYALHRAYLKDGDMRKIRWEEYR
ncbi:MAG TPA: acetyl-CoA hydrolase/transferase C-terminal domain-containing protein, partial [Rectinemataceae bacterium]|nr:acetyl-CoA hydrolase/transferase C-terminal domain-containing protein [Rectinemataceae bacterium]